MTMKSIDGFDWIPSGSNQAAINGYLSASGWYPAPRPNNDYSGTSAFWPSSMVTGRFSQGLALYFGNSIIASGGGPFFSGIIKTLSATYSDGVVSASLRRRSTADSFHNGGLAIGFWNAVNNKAVLLITLSPYGILRVWIGNTSNLALTQIITSEAGEFKEDVWFNLQAKVERSTTAGTLQVKVNNKMIIDMPVGNTGPYDIDSIAIGLCQQGGLNNYKCDTEVDDLYFMDLAGTKNNDFLGNLRVKSQVVIADGSHIDFAIGGTSPAATNWQSLNVIRTDESKYVYSPTVGDYDLYDIDPNQTGPFARAVQVRLVARQDDATQRTVKALLKTGSTLSSGITTFYLNQNYSHWCDIWETNPDTSTDFTGTEVNALEVGFEIDS